MPPNKTCTTCLKSEPDVHFKYQYNRCKDCCNQKIREYRDTYEGYLKSLVLSSQNSARNRKNKGRIEAGICEITFDDVDELWKQQHGLCYYSKIPMMTHSGTDWQTSLKRLDPNLGFIRGNVVVCCLEFNCFINWTFEKIRQLFQPIEFNHELISFDLPDKKRKTQEPIQIIILENGEEACKCHYCLQIKELSEYNINDLGAGCYDCRKLYKHLYLQAPRGHLLHLLQSARANNKVRQTMTTIRQRDSSFDIDFDFLVELYHKQQGRCAYSNIPLNFGSYHDHNWILSLERRDPLRGYTKDNVCFIAFEFNTCDMTCMTLNDVGNGSCAWSKDKFDYFKQHISDSLNKPKIKLRLKNKA